MLDDARAGRLVVNAPMKRRAVFLDRDGVLNVRDDAWRRAASTRRVPTTS